MTLHKLVAGNAYEYLLKSIAPDVAPSRRVENGFDPDYYTAPGNPPGIWYGSGLADLGLAPGDRVTEAQMKALFGEGRHPNAEEMIAAHIAERTNENTTEIQLREVRAEAHKAVKLGNKHAVYRNSGKGFDELVEQRLTQLRTESGREPTCREEIQARSWAAGQMRSAIAGFDTVFSPPKSAAVLWALHPDLAVRTQLGEAHHAAVKRTLDFIEAGAALTRVGDGGKAQINTSGLVIACFEHFDNRNGEPNPHTHAVIANKVLGTDGKWKALDARTLFEMTVTASIYYDQVYRAEVTSRLGVRWSARPDTLGTRKIVYEIDGVRSEWREHFSSRRAAIEARAEQLIDEYAAAHGRRPDTAVYYRLTRQATLETRRPKGETLPLADKLVDWHSEFTTAFGHKAVPDLLALTTTPLPTPRRQPLDPAQLATRALEAVAEHRAVWSPWIVQAQILRQIGIAGPVNHVDRDALAAAALDQALGKSLLLNGYRPVSEPVPLQRADGQSVFVRHGAHRYTSTAILNAETRILAAAQTLGALDIEGPKLAEPAVAAFEASTGRSLDSGQRELVHAFAYDTRQVSLGIGPAGTGKTTAMKALAAVLEAEGRRLVPLATTGAAAKRLAEELDEPVETIHRFNIAAPRTVADLGGFDFNLRHGDIVVVDEAGMAGTLRLDQLLRLCVDHGAALRLLGDPEQLNAVETGGMLRLLATETEHVDLTVLHRFADPALADATLQVRDGDLRGIDYFADRRLLHAGDRDAMLESVYTAWRADLADGKHSVMIAATNRDVAALNERARADRVATGEVAAEGLVLHDGNHAGVGDSIVTREGDRILRSETGDYVRNGETWTVTAIAPDGTLTAKRDTGHDTLTFPANYVAESIELAYALTAHRSQGLTVDTAHALIDESLQRQLLYVALSRAAEETHLYAISADACAAAETDALDKRQQVDLARIVMIGILERDGVEPTATQTLRDALNSAEGLYELVPRLQYLAERFPGASEAKRIPLHPALPWITLRPAELGETTLDDYRDQLMDAIDNRIEALTTTAIADPPAWMTHHHPTPTDPEEAERWRDNIALLAAWRDLRDIDTDTDTPWGSWVFEKDPAHSGFRTAITAAENARALTQRESADPRQVDAILLAEKYLHQAEHVAAVAMPPTLERPRPLPRPMSYEEVQEIAPIEMHQPPTQSGPTLLP